MGGGEERGEREGEREGVGVPVREYFADLSAIGGEAWRSREAAERREVFEQQMMLLIILYMSEE